MNSFFNMGIQRTKKFLPILGFVLAVWNASYAQVERFGLEGYTVNSLAVYGVFLYAGTNDGVWARHLADGSSVWEQIGLDGENVAAVYPHQYGPVGYAVTAGLNRIGLDTLKPLVWCACNEHNNWAPADTGIIRAKHPSIHSLDGFPSMVVCGETYAAGSDLTLLLRPFFDSQVWREEFTQGIGVVNVVRTNVMNKSVWIGGETGIFSPYIGRSDDLGKTFRMVYPNLSGDNACDALAFPPNDTSTVYAGMEGTVLKSTDGGATWEKTTLHLTQFYFYGLTVAQSGMVYAGGFSNSDETGLYSSTDAGSTWLRIYPQYELHGIRTMTTGFSVIDQKEHMYAGTGDGVIRLATVLGTDPTPPVPDAATLEPNYPNPFAGSTTLQFSLARSGPVSLTVHDVYGRIVATVIDGNLEAGNHHRLFDATHLPSGSYYCRLTAGNTTKSMRIGVMR